MEKATISVKVLKSELSKVKDNALVIGFFKDKLGLSVELKKLDKDFNNIVSLCIKNSDFKGEKGEVKTIFVNKNIKNIVLVGLGEEEKYSFDVFSSTIADVSKRLRDNSTESFSIHLESFKNSKLNDKETVEKIALSSLMGLYKFTEYKTKGKDKIKNIKGITIITDSNKKFDSQTIYASVVADAVNKTRDLVNTPPNVATPEYVANYAKELAKPTKIKDFRGTSKIKDFAVQKIQEFSRTKNPKDFSVKSNLKCTVFDEKQIAKMKMGCFIGVAQGSINKPRLVVLEYYGAGKIQKPIAIVGKGITFDSGGLNVKPYPFILNMKDDKGGAVAAMHVIEACSKLKLPVNLVVVAPLCENMIDAASYRPDDVLTAYNKMTVEIRNTDAEGRLVLADALAYAAEQYKPQAIIDIATLTGASMIVLGYAGTPFLSNDSKLGDKIKDASAKSLEKVWELPLWQEYEESIKSDVADVKHISDDGDAGVIIGATFLKNFVNDIPWVHIDIGTTVWSKVDKGVLTKGATGATVRLLMEMLREWKN
ncbi:leucyl aminopeptidase [Candidatus Woesearchaeota archaeon]|nr:leucyl aminopeptidase [Candidatus Woesearchaeota archaeon]